MMVTSWWRRSGWNSNSSGVNFFITSSSRSAATEGTPYQVLGSPLEVTDNSTTERFVLHPCYPTTWHLSSDYVDKHPVPVQVIDGVAPVVLNMPAEGRKHHSHIKPGDLHPRDVSIDVAKEGLLQQRHHIQVPATAGIILTRKSRGVSSTQTFSQFFNLSSRKSVESSHLLLFCEIPLAVVHGEAAPELFGVYICSIFHSHVFLDAADQPPEFSLHQLSGNHLQPTHTHRGAYSLTETVTAQACSTNMLRPSCSYMDWHVEVIRFESIRHFPKTLKSVLSRGLFKAKRFCRFLTFLKMFKWRKNKST